MDIWLDRLGRFISIIRPKAYNVFAKIVITLGVAQVVESQTKIVQAVFVELFEREFGPSDFLREFISDASSPFVGVFLIVVGLFYHYLVTVGKEQIETRLSLMPKTPTFELQVLNSDSDMCHGNVINLRGHIAIVPNAKEIPDFVEKFDEPDVAGFISSLSVLRRSALNFEYYRERAELLKIWGGSELIKLRIANNSEVFASGVLIEVKIPRIKGVSADNTKKYLPKFPREKVEDVFGPYATLAQHVHPPYYDITRTDSDDEYLFSWNVGEIQANTQLVSDVYIFLRSEVSVDIELTIYCDQLPAPINETYRVERKGKPINISIDDLKVDDEGYVELVNECVMDGYPYRKADRISREYEHEAQELYP